MDSLLKKYGYFPDNEKINRSLEMIASGLDNLVSEQVLKDKAGSYILLPNDETEVR